VSGAADALMEADFSFNTSDWKPEVSYDVSGDTGKLSIEQGSTGEGVRLGDEATALMPSGVGAEGGLGKINAEDFDIQGDFGVAVGVVDARVAPPCRSPRRRRADQPGGGVRPLRLPYVHRAAEKVDEGGSKWKRCP
jgi:hypothetical protein